MVPLPAEAWSPRRLAVKFSPPALVVELASSDDRSWKHYTIRLLHLEKSMVRSSDSLQLRSLIGRRTPDLQALRALSEVSRLEARAHGAGATAFESMTNFVGSPARRAATGARRPLTRREAGFQGRRPQHRFRRAFFDCASAESLTVRAATSQVEDGRRFRKKSQQELGKLRLRQATGLQRHRGLRLGRGLRCLLLFLPAAVEIYTTRGTTNIVASSWMAAKCMNNFWGPYILHILEGETPRGEFARIQSSPSY